MYRISGADAEEGTFLACGFWLAEALALLGDGDAATRQMDDMLVQTGGNVGLMHEQMDMAGHMLGNMPQALSHLAMIHAATAVSEVLQTADGTD